MARRENRPALDSVKRGQIAAILGVGCSMRTAAKIVGCSSTTIRNTANCDPAFAEEIDRAGSRTEVACVENLRKAAAEQRYWRAAAWALERRNPEDFGLRRPGTVSHAQIAQLIASVTDMIVVVVPRPDHRKEILKRLDRELAAFLQSAREEELELP